MKSQVVHTVWRNIAGEAAGEIRNWSPLGVKGLIDLRRNGSRIQEPYFYFLEFIPSVVYHSSFFIHHWFLCFLSIRYQPWPRYDKGDQQSVHNWFDVLLSISQARFCIFWMCMFWLRILLFRLALILCQRFHVASAFICVILWREKKKCPLCGAHARVLLVNVNWWQFHYVKS